MVEINCYQAMDKQCQMLATQIDLLEQEIQMAHTEWGLSKGRLEAVQADWHIHHLQLGQPGAQSKQNQVKSDLVQRGLQSSCGQGHPFWQREWCNWPRESGSSNDWYALVSVGTGQYDVSFVLPSISLCIISLGAATYSLTHSYLPYCCPIMCSLYCIGMTCGGPCLAPNY